MKGLLEVICAFFLNHVLAIYRFQVTARTLLGQRRQDEEFDGRCVQLGADSEELGDAK